jgi:hypothetical protein
MTVVRKIIGRQPASGTARGTRAPALLLVRSAVCSGVPRYKIDERYISRVLRLATLSPEVVESIVEGCHPPDLTLQMLLSHRIHVLLDWAEQLRALGIGEVAPRAVAASSTV